MTDKLDALKEVLAFVEGNGGNVTDYLKAEIVKAEKKLDSELRDIAVDCNAEVFGGQL